MPLEGGSVGGDRRRQVAGAQLNPAEPPENLPCPRCDSTKTKFCYYNNYNLSQPRYFCKGCRRYWTRGGTLRNVPVGGGSRKNSSSKRSRSSSSAPLHHPQPLPADFVNATTSFDAPVGLAPMNNNMVKGEITLSPLRCDFDLNEASFTSLLTANVAPPQGEGAFVGLGGYGLGLGFGLPGFHDMGFGVGPSMAENQAGDEKGVGNRVPSGCKTWQLGGSDGNGGGLLDDGDYFSWPDMGISTAGKGPETGVN